MQGLLEAVARQGYDTYLVSHRERESDQDPVEDLRRGWNLNVDFGLGNPELYTLMYGTPHVGAPHPAVAQLQDVLLELVRRVAQVGRLRVGVERAVDMLHATGVGVVLALIAQDKASLDLTLSVALREAVFAAIITNSHDTSTNFRSPAHGDVTSYAVALKASLSEDARPFTTAEHALFEEWLTRFIDTEP